MAAGLGFKTFATGDVLSAADTNGYLMQGVLVFASAAARDSSITSPQEGQFAYLKDTNVTTYYTGSAWTNLDTTGMTNPMTTTGDTIYSSSGSTPARLGIGTTGQVLTVASGVPSWATPAAGGGGGMTLLTSGSLTGSSVTTSSLAGGYVNLVVFIKDISWSQDNYTQWRFNGDSTSGNYKWTTTYNSSASVATSSPQSASAFWADAAVSAEDAADINRFYCFTVWDYTNTVTRKVVTFNGFTNDNNALFFTNEMASGTYMATPAAITSVTFFTGGGTFSGGTYEVYGVK